MTPDNHHYVSSRILRLNVGYITSQNVGFSRETSIEVPSKLQVTTDLILGHMYATLRLSHAHGGILVQGTVETSVLTDCSRCAEAVWLPVEFEIQELFATNDDLDTEYRVDDSNFLDLGPLIREEALLSVPMVTPTDAENRCVICERTFGDVLREHGLGDDIDPRLEILRSLRDQMNQSDE
ncbi:MAG: DUF177 domain-containing protein [Chloroflexi bacterium]|nr:DUF177 domain-containing protein [Chloroflexota bacterium]